MQNSEIISSMKDYTVDYIKNSKKKVLPSVIIGIAITRLAELGEDGSDALMVANNPFCLKAGKKFSDPVQVGDSSYKTFKTLTDALDAFYPTVANSLNGIVSTNKAVDTLSIPVEEKLEILDNIESNNLMELDKDIIEEIVKANPIEAGEVATHLQNPADLDTKKSAKTEEESKTETKSVTKQTEKPVQSKATTKKDPNRIVLVKANLYATQTSTVPVRSVSGTYYLQDVHPKNGRLPIVTKPEFISDASYIMGWVKENEIVRQYN